MTAEADAKRGRRIATIVALCGAGFVASMLYSTGGRVALPLDDSFIYFRYAERFAAGHGFEYQPGDGATTGATSIPWVLLLSCGSLLGFDRMALAYWAILLGGVLLSLIAGWAADAQQALAPRKPGSERPGDLPIFGVPLAGALVLLSGPLQWGSWSGMEIPLTAAAILAAFLAWTRAGGAPSRTSAIALAALAVVRPEGALLAVIAVALWATRAREIPRRTRAWALVPIAAAAVVPILSWALTGDPRSSGYLAKASLAGPDVLDSMRVALLRGTSLAAAQLFGSAPLADGLRLYAYGSESAAMFVPLGAGVLFLVGILPAIAREARDRQAGPGILAALWIAAMYMATGLIEEPDAHHGRYQMPVLPVFLVYVALGVGRVSRVLRESRAGLDRLADGVRLLLAAGGVVSLGFFLLAYGDQCADIDRMQVRLAEGLRRTLEPQAVVAVNDAGAIAYISGRRTVDLVGLTTPGLAKHRREGTGVLGEQLEAMPSGKRPDWFCIFPNWFDFAPAGILSRAGGVRLLSPSIVDAEKVVFRADWSLAGSGDRPHLAGELGALARVADRLDVADPASEAAHEFAMETTERGAAQTSFLHRGATADETEILDGGRVLFGSARFTAARDPLSPALIVVRTVGGAVQRVRVTVDDGPASDVEIPAATTRAFQECVVGEIPPGSGPARITIAGVAPLGDAPLLLCHVFALTGVAP